MLIVQHVITQISKNNIAQAAQNNFLTYFKVDVTVGMDFLVQIANKIVFLVVFYVKIIFLVINIQINIFIKIKIVIFHVQNAISLIKAMVAKNAVQILDCFRKQLVHVFANLVLQTQGKLNVMMKILQSLIKKFRTLIIKQFRSYF
ncbi:transmembrane protein, putative (macronuclear) [Tetrahymena thermophila SB210]|uniref:Transmembrane protein, putative n=1 Tax=Tetrahymena thermophila (strain SB210) TaxID=312017 RepID=W7XCV1_TETTS|nr:transmembrane protein, putative [Tetrahymena thermophila SB210]EWS74398.1 transmembrane protein, putative [Tetrahymena thermophila SB210]|eukprot:XP_012653075.1 transmembrane protein, putative [Tetrahymena thermophila SB210]